MRGPDVITMYQRLIHICAWFAACLMVLAGAMLTYEVVARYFFIRPTIWAGELSQLCLIWGCMIGMPQLMKARQHITVSAITSLLQPGARKVAELCALACVLVFSTIVALYGWDIFHDSFQRGRTTGSLLDMPIWVVELAIPVGFALLAVQALIEIVQLARGAAIPEEAAHE